MKAKNKILALFIIIGLFLFPLQFISASDLADHLVISQVQITGGAGKTTNDFVELYNPTNQDIDLSGKRLVKRTKTGQSDTLLKSWTETAVIAAHGYYLWANSDFLDIAVSANATTTGSLAADNGVALRDGPNDSGTVIDMVAWGEAENAFVEGQVFPINPEAGQSLERKPGAGLGNGEDTEISANDFILQNTSHPRNSQSAVEPAFTSEEDEDDDANNNPLPPPPPPEDPEPAEGPPPPPPAPGSGSGQSIVSLQISEILPNPKGTDSGMEWIEIYNSGSDSADLSGWYVDDEGTEDKPGSSALKLPDGSMIQNQEYEVIEIPAGKFSLNNADGDEVRIFDSSKVLRFRQAYPGPAADGMTYARSAADQWEWTDTPTPGTANQFIQAINYVTHLRISEIFPNPRGSDLEEEFIEIVNYGTDSVALDGWTVADKSNKYSISEGDFLDTELSAGKHFLLRREITKIALNNSGEEQVKLFNPAGAIVDTVSFDAAGHEAQSYAHDGQNKYQWTTQITPEEKNIIQFVSGEEEMEDESQVNDLSSVKSAKSIAINFLRAQEKGALVTVAGIVSVGLGIFSDNVFYLSDHAGVRVILEEGVIPDLALGQEILVAGIINSYHNELELEVENSDSLQVTGIVKELKARAIKTSEIGENTEGSLVMIAGPVVSSSGDTFFVDDGSGGARIYIKESTGILKPRMRKGDFVTITGIVSQFDETYRLMPRYQDDLVVGRVAGLSNSGSGDELPRTGTNFWLVVALLWAICYSGLEIFALNKGKNLIRNGKKLIIVQDIFIINKK